MVAAGAVLLLVVAAYYAYGVSARSSLDDLSFAVADSSHTVGANSHQSTMPQTAQVLISDTGVEAQSVSVSPQETLVNVERSGRGIGLSAIGSDGNGAGMPAAADNPAQAAPGERIPLPADVYADLYPALQTHPKFWDEPTWAGGEPYLYAAAVPEGLPHGFHHISAEDGALRRGQGAPTERIAVPLIGLNSNTTELGIVDLGNSRAYETPKNIVGHIPSSANPGERGNAWYFGHLESPIRGEGNVFHRLPEIPDLLRNGDNVYVELDASDGRTFLYEVVRTEVIHRDELSLYGSDAADLTMVTCVPRLVYDHRLVVTAELVGMRDALN